VKLIDRIDKILNEDLATLPSLDSGVGTSEVPDEFDVDIEPIEEGDDVQDAKKALIQTMKGRALVRDLGDDIISIATGDEYSVKVKILGWDKK